ncbi:bifunctional serine/threonine-protein kinase/formylglycine-generating enzyme family protein [Planctomycetaceae bacterium SH139]
MQPSEPRSPGNFHPAPNFQLILEKLSDRGREAFERDGSSPIEQLVAEAPAEYQDKIFVQLLVEEYQLRKMRGETATLEMVRQRFPTRLELVEKAWREIVSTSPFAPPKSAVAPGSPGESPQFASTVDNDRDDSDAAAAGSPGFVADSEDPPQFGPYKVLKSLGAGTFGSVYKAQHESSGKVVAVKMLKSKWARDPECGQAMQQQFADEAKMMLQFDHPHVVKVISLDDRADPPYFVQEYIDGETLASRLQTSRPAIEQAVQYAIQIAAGLAHIHSRERWHRDLKPANILLDRNNHVYLADFGLALDDAQRWRSSRGPAGTYPYMAPEQVKGATHRLNARCDIWALGVILYEMLTGRRPFRGETRDQLCDEIIERTPAAPRELDRSIPRELNRLCMQCLSKRDADRPHAAADLQDDLEQILQRLGEGSSSTTAASTSPAAVDTSVSGDSTQPTPVVEYPIPTLKRFTAEQAELYLRLMPRSYANPDELPELIAYWKQRILERDPDETFAVGIMVGVSGCGKSSMLEAGLVPALPASVIPILIEASERDTEIRILNKLRRAIPDAALDKKWSLVDWAFRLRSGSLLPADKKVVFILDQFEQWLNAHGGETTNQLLDALHQCDGEHLQAIVCVREGFHATLMRFVQALDLHLDDYNNYVTAHRFTPDHARFVLTQFGRGLKRLDDPITESQQAFIDATVEGLAESDRGVVCVRLVVLALVMQDRPWTVEELNSLGGLDGIGAQFLVDCFEGRTASEQYRRYLPAAMRVLSELLPAEGLEIKDVRSYDQLLAASELDKLQFDDLLNILTRKLFLLSLVEADTGTPPLATSNSPLATNFQLTHDFLVPSIREWLARKLRETKAGRAQLRLQERTTAWNSKPENRNLPSLWEWITIRRLTDRQKWKPNEQATMRHAGRVHAIRSGLLTTFAIALLLGGVGVKRGNDARLMERDATNLVSSIESADYAKLPEMISQLDPMRLVAVPKLRQALDQHDLESDERLKLSLGLLASDPGQVDYLLQRLLTAEARQVPLLVDQLTPYAEQILPQLWIAAEKLEPKSLLQVASALAAYDPSNEDWQSISAQTADQVVRENPLRIATWIETLRPVASQLNPELKRICAASSEARSQTQIDLATDLLETYAAEDFELLHELILVGGPRQFARFFGLYSRFRPEAIERMRSELASPFQHNGSESETELDGEAIEALRLAYIARKANAAVALLRLEDAQPIYDFLTVDRDLEALSQFIYRVRGREVSPLLLIKSFEELRSKPALADPLQQQQHLYRLYGFLLGMGEFSYDELPAQQRDGLIEELADMYAAHPSRAIHSALGWLLRRWDQDELVRRVDETPLDYDETGQREWFVMKIEPTPPDSLEAASEDADLAAPNSSAEPLTPVIDLSAPIYFTMIVFPGGEFTMGDPGDRELVEVAGPIAVSDREVTWRQFSAIDGDTHRQGWERQFKKALGPEDPVFGVSWFEAVNYCRWLTSARGLDEESQSYLKLDFPEGANTDPGWLDLPSATEWPMRVYRPGFRLPTEAEWEYVARAGTETTYSFGDSVGLLGDYCWHDKNSNDWSHRAGQLRPSIGGLFDIHGNLWEWVDDWYTKGSARVYRGGGWDSAAAYCSAAGRSNFTPSYRTISLGFRLALSPSGVSGPAEPATASGEAEPSGVGTEGASAEQRPEMP